MPTSRISVVIAARDAERTLGATLDGLAAQDLDARFEVVVVDNGSRDGTAAIAETHPRVDRVIRRERGDGPGAARNGGVAAATGEVIAFTDADCAPAPGWLRAGLAIDADIIQGRVEPAGPAGPFDHTLWVTQETGLYETANLFVRREWLDPGFEDAIDAGGRPFGEDVVFAWRAKRAGARTAFAPGALVHHAVFGGTAHGYVRERARDAHFAELASLVPELREGFFYRRFFLSRRSAALALGLLPVWVHLVLRESRRRTGVTSGRVAVAVAIGDLVALRGLLRESLRRRTLLF